MSPGGPAHQSQHAMEKLMRLYPVAKVILPRDVLDERAIIQLERHSKVKALYVCDCVRAPYVACRSFLEEFKGGLAA